MAPRLRPLLTQPNDATQKENRLDLRVALKKGQVSASQPPTTRPPPASSPSSRWSRPASGSGICQHDLGLDGSCKLCTHYILSYFARRGQDVESPFDPVPRFHSNAAIRRYRLFPTGVARPDQLSSAKNARLDRYRVPRTVERLHGLRKPRRRDGADVGAHTATRPLRRLPVQGLERFHGQRDGSERRRDEAEIVPGDPVAGSFAFASLDPPGFNDPPLPSGPDVFAAAGPLASGRYAIGLSGAAPDGTGSSPYIVTILTGQPQITTPPTEFPTLPATPTPGDPPSIPSAAVPLPAPAGMLLAAILGLCSVRMLPRGPGGVTVPRSADC